MTLVRSATTALRATWVRALLALGVCAALAAIAYPRLERVFLLQAEARGDATLRLAVEGLEGALNRFEPLPALIAERAMLRALLKQPDNAELLATANEEFRQLTYTLGASDVYLMDIAGHTLAASSYRKAQSFVGRNFSFRPYFTQALDGGIGRYFALGTTSGERGYFFAAPVEDGRRVIGVVAVKFTVDAFETAWRQNESTLIVTDLDGVIFMSSRPDLHFRALAPPSPQARSRIAEQRQYPLDEVVPLDLERETIAGDLSLWRIGDDAGPAQDHVASSQTIPQAGWTVTVLTPRAPAAAQALTVVVLGALAAVIAMLATAIVMLRRARLRERIAIERSQNALLEGKVEARTAELDAANRQLRQEVEERRDAETRLRNTQAELVQAGKLAALGQMSAVLSHEINQPLAATRSYAENAVKLLDAGRTEAARDNLGRIAGMVERMASIARHLRNFARRPGEEIKPVPLGSVLRDAVALIQPRADKLNARLTLPPEDFDPWVRGGNVRLQQVLVNLLNNALDAMEGDAAPRVDVTLEDHGDKIRLAVRDHGPGIDPTARDRLFDPFFTTKPPGKGVGLGLSISYNILRDFGGSLEVRDADGPGPGAVFVLTLRATDERREIAAQ